MAADPPTVVLNPIQKQSSWRIAAESCPSVSNRLSFSPAEVCEADSASFLGGSRSPPPKIDRFSPASRILLENAPVSGSIPGTSSGRPGMASRVPMRWRRRVKRAPTQMRPGCGPLPLTRLSSTYGKAPNRGFPSMGKPSHARNASLVIRAKLPLAVARPTIHLRYGFLFTYF